MLHYAVVELPILFTVTPVLPSVTVTPFVAENPPRCDCASYAHDSLIRD
jgi:hypothetical protein